MQGRNPGLQPPDAVPGTDVEKRRAENMSKVLDVVAAVCATRGARAFLETVTQAAEDIMNAEAASLMIVDRGKEQLRFAVATGPAGHLLRGKSLGRGQGIAGWVTQTGVCLLSNRPYEDPRFDPSFDEATGFVTRSYLCMPLHIPEEGVIGTLQVLNKRDGAFGDCDAQLFSSYSDLVAVLIQGWGLAELVAASETAGESEPPATPPSFPRALVEAMRPDRIDSVRPFLFTPHYHGPEDAGNVFYGLVGLPNGPLLAYLGTFSGHEADPPFLVPRLISEVRSLLERTYDMDAGLQRLNRLVQSRGGEELRVSWVAAVLDPATETATLYSAGQPLAVTVGNRGVTSATGPPGPPFGETTDIVYEPQELPLAAGDVLLLTSETSLSCCRDSSEDLVELQAFADICSSHAGSPDCVEDIFDDVVRKTSAASPRGEAVVLAVERTDGDASRFESRELVLLSNPEEAASLKIAAAELVGRSSLDEREALIWTTGVVKGFLELAEHAYAGRRDGRLDVKLRRTPGRLTVSLRHYGQAIPAEKFVEVTEDLSAASTARFLQAQYDGVELLPAEPGDRLRLVKRLPV